MSYQVNIYATSRWGWGKQKRSPPRVFKGRPHLYKLTNLLTKFFPAGSDRSHFLLCALSEVLNGKLSSSVRLPGWRRRLSRVLKTTERRRGPKPGTGRRQRGRSARPRSVICRPCSCLDSSEKLVSETPDVAETRIDAILTLQG